MFAVHFLSQHSIAPGDEHLNMMKHIYHYLIGTQDLGLFFHSNLLNANLIGFSNSDWAGDLNSRILVSGYAFTSENCACVHVTKFGVAKLQSEYLNNIYIN